MDEIKNNKTTVLIVLGILSLNELFIIMLIIDSMDHDTNLRFTYGLMVAGVLGAVIILYFIYIFFRQRWMEITANQLAEEEEWLKNSRMLDYNKEEQKYRRRIKKQVKLVKTVIQSSKKEYKKIEPLLNHMTQQEPNFSYNAIIDALIDEKRSVCMANGIDFICDLHLLSIGDIKDVHLYSIISNLIDNGIEACMEEDIQVKWMRLESKKHGNYLYIRSQNPTTQVYDKRSARLGRGHGREIIKEIAESYGGRYQWEYREGVHTDHVVLGLKK